MSVSLPLDKMSITEKIHVMEEIWKDLTSKPEDYSSPHWHAEVLKDRRNSMATNNAVLNDWPKAKKKILDSI